MFGLESPYRGFVNRTPLGDGFGMYGNVDHMNTMFKEMCLLPPGEGQDEGI
jgi:hypothetical protein